VLSSAKLLASAPNPIACADAVDIGIERSVTVGHVYHRLRCYSRALDTGGRVVEARGVVIERSKTSGCVLLADGVLIECSITVGSVVAGVRVVRERISTSGTIAQTGEDGRDEKRPLFDSDRFVAPSWKQFADFAKTKS